MSRFNPSPFDDDDPAVAWTRQAIQEAEQRRLQEALARMDAPQTAQDVPRAAEAVEVAPEPITEQPFEPKRNIVGELVQRIRDGDLSAIDALRRLVDR